MKTIRLNKRTSITFELPYINISDNYINLVFETRFGISKYLYDISDRPKLRVYYNLDIEIYILGFGISIETMIKRNSIDSLFIK